MGDRRFINIKDENGSATIYTHWAGTRAPAIVAQALDASGSGRPNYHGNSYSTAQLVYRLIDEFKDESTGDWLSCGLTFDTPDYDEENTTIRIELLAEGTVSIGTRRWSIAEYIEIWPSPPTTEEMEAFEADHGPDPTIQSEHPFWLYVREVGETEEALQRSGSVDSGEEKVLHLPLVNVPEDNDE